MESRLILKRLPLPNRAKSFLDIYEDRIVGKHQREKLRNQEINENKVPGCFCFVFLQNLKVSQQFYRHKTGNASLAERICQAFGPYPQTGWGEVSTLPPGCRTALLGRGSVRYSP